MNKFSLFGGTGFVLGNFAKLYADFSYIEPRENNIPKHTNIIYGISTTHNYFPKEGNVFIDVNTNITKFLQVLDNLTPNHTINFLSSWFVYGKAEHFYGSEDGICTKEDIKMGNSCVEWGECSPRGFYSITKRTAEQLLISLAELRGFNYRILRLSNIVGPGDKFSEKKNALQYLINKLKNNENIELYNAGDFWRNYLDVDEASRAIKFVSENGKLNEIYNIGNNENSKFIDLISYCVQKLNSQSLITSRMASNFHKNVQVENFRMNTNKLKNLGFKWQLNIEQTLDKVLEK